MEVRLGLEGPDVDDGFGGPLANGFEGFSFALDGLRVRVVHLVRMVEGAVAVAGLVDVIV